MLEAPFRVARTALLSLSIAGAALAPGLATAHPHGGARRASERLDALLRDPPPVADPFYEVGVQLLRVEDHDRAATAFREAAKRSTNPANSYYNLACALALKGSTDEAFAALRSAIDAGFDDPDHMAEDDDLDRLHADPRFDALLAEAEALEMPPVNPGHWHGGWWQDDRGERRSRSAVKRLEAYLASHPRSGRAAYGLGIGYLNLDDLEASARSFQRALELGYRKDATLYNLACVEARRERLDAAFAYLDRAIEAGFHEPGQIRSDDDLDALRGDPRYRAAIRKADQLARADGRNERGWSWPWDDDEDEDD